jgi:predicted phage terminase large subunit-like protein
MVFLPPRSGKSQMASIFLPAWYVGLYSDRKVMQASYAAELAVGFGRQVRALVGDQDFQGVFPGVGLQPDNKAAGRWALTGGGEYYASGVMGGIAGKGFNLGIIDDPLSEQDAYSALAKKRVHEWYGPGFYTRRQPEASAILYMGTRWAKDDLAGHLLALSRETKSADKWTVLSIPAIVDAEAADLLNSVAKDPLLSPTSTGKPIRYRAGMSFSPRRWPVKELMRQKANMASRAWEALYQQKPVEDEGNILKRSWWRKLTDGEFEEIRRDQVEYVVQVYDTAFEEGEENDFSARTTWGVFRHTDTLEGVRRTRHCCVLLEAWRGRVGFPELRSQAMAAYKVQRPKPNRVLIEKKASGHSLIQELRRAGVPVTAIKAEKDKLSRAYAAQIVLEQGGVFHPDRDWAQDVINEAADFPYGEHNDWTDTCVHAWLWLRKAYQVQLADEDDDDNQVKEDRSETRRLFPA